MRGSNSHGGGHKKKRRGAGHRGGKGFSGTGARGDQKKPGVIIKSKKFVKALSAKKGVKASRIAKSYTHFGKKGFKSLDQESNNTLSLAYIESHFDKMVEQGLIVKEKDEFIYNASEAGYDKILGKGDLTRKVTIIVDEMSKAARKRVEDLGGKVELSGGDDFEPDEEVKEE